MSLIFLLLLLLSSCRHNNNCLVDGSFLDIPFVQWTYRLPGSGTLSGRGMKNGNEVLASPDGTTLFATADDGSLHFVNLQSLRNSFSYEPPVIPGTSMECRSGVTLVYDHDSNNNNNAVLQYVVYTVVDVPVRAGVLYDNVQYDPDRTSTLSRLLAVNLDGTLRYSVPLNGVVVGKPIAGRDGKTIYVVHNVPNFIGSSPTRGKISVILEASAGTTDRPSVTASLSPLNQQQNGPFGPPTGQSVLVVDQVGDSSTTSTWQDVVVMAESWEDGYSATNGNVYLLRQSSLYDDFNGQGNDAYELTHVSDWSVASVAKPSLKSDATQFFLGATGARLSGWTDLSPFIATTGNYNSANSVVDPKWDLSFEPNKGNASQPLLVAPILSADETLLYQVGASTEIYCVDAQKGNVVWNSDGALRGIIVAEPRLVQIGDEEPKVYVIEGLKGKVRQHDALTGSIDWSFDCQSVSGIFCNDAVEADFSVAPSGNTLYYGDIFGKIVALEIAAFSPSVAPTQVPTIVPVAEDGEEEDEANMATTPPVLEPAERTASPTWYSLPVAPVATTPVVVVPATPVPVPTPVPGIDGVPYDNEGGSRETATTEPPGGGQAGPENEPVGVVEQPPNEPDNTGFETSAAINAAEDDGKDSFFSNDIMIILVAVCGGLALAIIVLLIAQKARNLKNNKGSHASPDHMLISPEDDAKDWHSAQDEYEEACRRNEEETLREIVSMTATTPTKGTKKGSKKQKRMSPVTPSTLASIEESPAENEKSFESDLTPKSIDPKNLEKSFEATFTENQEVTLKGPVASEAKEPHVKQPEPKQSVEPAKKFEVTKEKAADINVESNGPPEMSSVEVVAKPNTAKAKSQAARRAMSPEAQESVDGASNDVMSVDGSLYFDDDSFIQGSNFEVASLSKFSVASSKEGGSDLGGNFPQLGEDGQIRYEAAHGFDSGDHVLRPSGYASPSLLRPSLNPVTDYLLRNEASMSSSPTTPVNGNYTESHPPLSPSPVTPPSETGTEDGFDKEVARAGQSVRLGGSLSGQKGGKSDGSAHRTPPPPRPPVDGEEDDEPEDAWNSFLSELAKAEREFFNPSFNKKKKGKEKGKERPQSPPPPPPPSYPPPDQPPTGGAVTPPPIKGQRRQLL